MAYTIDDCYNQVKYKANQSGASSNIPPDRFNPSWKRAELKYFNAAFKLYAENQVVSDTISKWMMDPLYIPIDSTGRFDFFTEMNLLHVDSLNGYIQSTGTKIRTLNTLVGGTGYTDGSYIISLTGGSGTGAKAFVVIIGGIVKTVIPTSQGTGYAVNDTLTGTLPLGSGFSIKVASLTGATKPYDIIRVEKNRVAAHLSSEYDEPTSEFPIYTQYSSWLQFYPVNSTMAQLVYLKQPVASFWAYTLNGSIGTFAGLTGGTAYTNGTYNNVPLTGGVGNSALATIVVAGGVVSSVTITNPGKIYRNADVLSALAANIGGTGTGFAITISSINNPRPIYNPANSIQPLWNDYDISQIVDLCLQDIAISARDPELQQFSESHSIAK